MYLVIKSTFTFEAFVLLHMSNTRKKGEQSSISNHNQNSIGPTARLSALNLSIKGYVALWRIVQHRILN